MKKTIPSLFLMLIGCSQYITYYRYEINATGKAPQTISIAPLNILEVESQTGKIKGSFVDSALREYLVKNNKKIVPNNSFESIWLYNLGKLDGLYNSSNGKIKKDTMEKLIIQSVQAFCELNACDAMIFPAIVERKALLSGPYGCWDGATRKLPMDNTVEDPNKYYWVGNVKAASIKITIYSKDGKLYFKSFGGLELITKITYDGKQFKSINRENFIEDNDYLTTAIRTAFHPFVIFKEYPKSPHFAISDSDHVLGITITPVQNENLKESKKWDKF